MSNPTNPTNPTMLTASVSSPFAFGDLFRGRIAPLLVFALALVAVSTIALVSCSNGSAQASNEEHKLDSLPFAELDAQAVAASPAPAAQAQLVIGGGPCPCPFRYVRTSVDYAVAKGDTHVEVDTDAGLPVTVTLPASPDPLERHEIWLTDQPGTPNGSLTIDPNGQAVHLPAGVSLTIPATSPNEGLVLLFVQPQPPPAGGYWRVSRL